MENKSYQLRYLPIFEQDLISTANYITNVLKNEDATQHIPLSQARAGDLVFFRSTYNAGRYVTHVGIYAGNNKMYHAGDLSDMGI